MWWWSELPFRLKLVLIFVISILLGVPVWWKTTSLYRAPLPYSEIHTLTSRLTVLIHSCQQTSLSFPKIHLTRSLFSPFFFRFNTSHGQSQSISFLLVAISSPKSSQVNLSVKNFLHYSHITIKTFHLNWISNFSHLEKRQSIKWYSHCLMTVYLIISQRSFVFFLYFSSQLLVVVDTLLSYRFGWSS